MNIATSNFRTKEPIQFRLDTGCLLLHAEAWECHQLSRPTGPALQSESCSPATPVGKIEEYTREARAIFDSISQVVDALTSRSLHMKALAQLGLDFGMFLSGLPQFCTGRSNQSAFNTLKSAVNDIDEKYNRGVARFEDNLQSFVGKATPLLNNLYNECENVDTLSRDFTGVVRAINRYNLFAADYDVDIRTISDTIEDLWDSFSSDLSMVDGMVERAFDQIETNVEGEAQFIVAQQKAGEAAFHEWENVNGKLGYTKYVDITERVVMKFMPTFYSFLERVPRTNRIDEAEALAQQAYEQIKLGMAVFPTFEPLPQDSTQFPHKRYRSDERKFGEAVLLSVVQTVCKSHFDETNHKLHIGDMQLKHGGRTTPHVSHKEGIDADIDPVEVGNIPNNDKALALSAAKRFIMAGAKSVFYADRSVIRKANKWAKEEGLEGRLQFEKDHTRHFHIRVR